MRMKARERIQYASTNGMMVTSSEYTRCSTFPLAMALPISTPPNALSHATGMIKQAEMARIGILVGVIGIGLAYAMLIFLGETGLFGA